MATIIQQPDPLSMSGNIKKFILNSDFSISFVLQTGGSTVFEAVYEAGTVEVDIKQLVENKLAYKLSDGSLYEQTDIVKIFTAQIDEAPVTFTVIRCGVANLSDTPSNWLKVNFLTWQPQSKAVTYYSPEWLTYYAVVSGSLKLKAYYADETTQVVTLGTLTAGKAYTANLQYAHIAGMLGAGYPTHFEVWAENNSGARLSFIQRYYYSEPRSEEEQWFQFENSLGGMDTVRCYGSTDFEGEHEHKVSTIGGTASEVRVNTKRNYSKNTGHLSDYERKWLLDFFPSRQKYIYALGGLRNIVVVDSDVKYHSSNLPSSYTFKYRFADDSAALLNLIKNADVVPHGITVPDIDSPGFFLPPRLAEYPRVTLSGGVLIPAFDPLSEVPSVTTFGALIEAFGIAHPKVHVIDNLSSSSKEASLSANMGRVLADLIQQGSDKHYEHSQGLASDTWLIHHNLGKYPAVSVIDSMGNEVIGNIKYIDNNRLELTFNVQFSGKAICN